ncbi:MAG: tail fiber domain-containing protein [Pseudomonadota bacterium]
MRRLFTLCLGLLTLTATSSLFAQTGNFTTLNVNSSTGTAAGTWTAPNTGPDLDLNIFDDYFIDLGTSSTPSYNIRFDGTTNFEMSTLSFTNYIALFRPNGTNNNLGHLEAGSYGNISGTAKWLGLGSAPAGTGASAYGQRIQWNSNFGIFNLVERNATTRDLVVAWGGTASNNRLLFQYSNAPTTPPSNVMQIESNGNVGIGATPLADDKLRVAGRIHYGSVEYIEDGGGFETTVRGSFRPDTDDSWRCGTSNFRWDAVFAQNGMIQTSDRRAKTNIEGLNYGLKEIMELRPVSYNWKDDDDKGLHLGMIAQELQEVVPEMVYNPAEDYIRNEEGNLVPAGKEGDLLGVKYDALIPVLVKGMQEQQAQVLEQQAQILDQNERIAELEAQLAASGSKSGQSLNDLDLPKLYQNNPNPFREETNIRFFLPQTVQEAILFVYDMQGQPVLEILITDRGDANQRIDGGLLPQGMYLYALIADGREVDVKRMILTK